MKTGVVAVIRGGKPGKTVAIREDIDALPMKELTGLLFASENDGACHSCGHDIHTTVLLYCAKVLSEIREELAGTVMLIFQPAEEHMGAGELVDCNFTQVAKPDAFIGLHVSPEIDAGSIGLKKGPANASNDFFNIKIKGKGGHGAHPENCIDPVVIAGYVITQLQTVISRENYPVYPGVVEDYDEEIDEQFDLLYVKGYIKTAHGNGYSASASSSKATMVEGDTTTITLTTFKFTPGLRVPYAIEGVGAENITIPKYGYVNIGLNGNASISFTLKSNSPRTDSNKLTVEFAIMGGVKTTVPYTLNANSTYTGKIGAFDGMNDVVQKKHVVGDTFYVCISQHGLSGKTVRLTGLFSGQGNHQLHINNKLAVGTNGGYVDVVMPANGADLYVPIRSTQVGKVATSSLNFSLSYNSVVLSTYSVPAELLKLEAFWIDSSTNQRITAVKDTKPFKLVVKHNSNQSLNFALAVTENTVVGEITPDVPASIIGTMTGVVESNIFVVNRGDRSLTDRLTVKVISPRESSDTVSPTITFQPS
jgi:hypothetical protein